MSYIRQHRLCYTSDNREHVNYQTTEIMLDIRDHVNYQTTETMLTIRQQRPC